MYEQYKKGFSLEEVGKMFGMTRQSVYDGFKRRGYVLRKKMPLPFQTFNNIRFTKGNHGYYKRTDKDRGLMHRYVWEYYNGPIPEGWDIHHKNGKKGDNRIENLEIFTKSEHASNFNTGRNQYAKSIIQKTNKTN